MCISNIGNRRPFPVAGVARKPNNDASLLLRAAVKDDMMFREQLDMSAFEPKPLPDIQEQNNNSTNNTLDSFEEAQPQSINSHSNQKAHIIVQHHYHDHSQDARALYQEEHPARGGVTTPFPLKLHEMLETVQANGHEHIVSWQPHGRCFVVHKPKEFVELLPGYFKLSKLASFQRQLNLYGFQRLTRGRDKGGYYHELFLKSKVFLAHNIQRIKVKGTGVRARSNPAQEPDFWRMGWISQDAASDDASDHTPTLSSPPVEKSIAQLPLNIETPVPLLNSSTMLSMPSIPWTSVFTSPQQQQSQQQPFDDDVLCAFGDKTFHYLPHERTNKLVMPQVGMDNLLASEAEAFFEDFDFPENIGTEIEDDNVFGDMLEQMIA